MTWPEKQNILTRLGITGFQSEEHFNEWLKWDCEKEMETRIIKAFKQF